MPRRPKNYYRPSSLDEALEYLKQPDSAPLGGGTSLLGGDINPSLIVDLQDVGLSGIELSGGILRIGATTTLTDIIESDVIEGDATPVLRETLHSAGPNTFRNAATLGGVIGTRDSNEVLALLLALDTNLVMADQIMSLADYLTPDERPIGLITAVEIPFQAGTGAVHRVARTPADAPIVAVVAWLPANATNVQIGVCGIAQRPVRLPDCDSLDAALAAAESAVTHPGDFRGSTEYRREMVSVLLRRALVDVPG